MLLVTLRRRKRLIRDGTAPKNLIDKGLTAELGSY